MGLAFLITSDNLRLLSERKVLKEAEYAALLDAASVIETAQQEAARIVERAGSEALTARDAGYAEGLERARAECAQRLISEAVATQRQLYALRTTMAEIIVRAVGQFMSEADPVVLFEAALLRVGALLRSESFVTVRVRPGEEENMRVAMRSLSDEAGGIPNMVVTTDPHLPPGGCVLVTGSGTLEIGADAQLEAFRKAIERDSLSHATRPAS
jgi:type III secretion protein L